MLIDTHSHIYDEQFGEDRDEVIARAVTAGVGRILLPAIDRTSDDALFDLVRRYPTFCYPMMGLHPTSVNDNPHFREELKRVADYLKTPPQGIRFYGVGEIGLDLYWSRDFRLEQEEALRIQIELALQYDLPIVLHTRDAWDEMCTLLSAYRGRGLRGVMHSFSGTIEHYDRIRELGLFYFGIGGPVTYKRSTLAEIVPKMDLSDLVLETDSPYLPPVPFRGKRNESSYMRYVCDRVAELYGISPKEVETVTTRNAESLFGWTPSEKYFY